MPRATYGVARHRKKKRILRRARGFRGGRSNLWRSAKEAVQRAEQYSTIHRQTRKRDFRRLWITRLSAACRGRGISYSRFMSGLKKADIRLDRKQLSELAIRDAAGFDRLVELAQQAR